MLHSLFLNEGSWYRLPVVVSNRSNLNVCGWRVDLQFRIIGCLFLSFASDFAESNEYQANEGHRD
jgi:hypothetical protein